MTTANASASALPGGSLQPTGDWLWWLKRGCERFLRTAKTAIVLLSSYYIYQNLAKLSAPALWVPRSLKFMVTFIVVTAGTATFEYVNSRCKAADLRRADHSPVRKAKSEAQDGGWAIFWLAVAVLPLFTFLGVRVECVRHWDSRDWASNERDAAMRSEARLSALANKLQPRRPNTAPANLALSAAPEPAPSKPTWYSRLHQFLKHFLNVGADDPPNETNLPDFANPTTELIYLPLWYPAEMKRYLYQKGVALGGGIDEGLQDLIDNDPDTLFSELQKATFQTSVTNLIFVSLDLLIICCVAAGLAYIDDCSSNVFNLGMGMLAILAYSNG